jgi:hypothetical protein
LDIHGQVLTPQIVVMQSEASGNLVTGAIIELGRIYEKEFLERLCYADAGGLRSSAVKLIAVLERSPAPDLKDISYGILQILKNRKAFLESDPCKDKRSRR